jgi:hypothetical protein
MSDVRTFIKRLGGGRSAAALFDRTPQAVSTWCREGRMPVRLYPLARGVAKRLGLEFRDEWFGLPGDPEPPRDLPIGPADAEAADA